MPDTGWIFPGTAVGNRVVSGSDRDWSNPDNIKATPGGDALITTHPTTSSGLAASNFDFSSISAGAVIDGIEARVGNYRSGVPETMAWSVGKLILADDSDGSVSKHAALLTPTSGVQTDEIGGASDLWSETISRANVQDVDWGFFVAANTTDSGDTNAVDFMQMKVYWTLPVTITSVNAGAAWTDGDTNIEIIGTNLF